MAETALSTAVADALSGTTDSDTDAVYPTIGESSYYTTVYRMLNRILLIEKVINELRVFKDGDLTYGIRAGRGSHGTNEYTVSAVAAQALTNDTTNYIWLYVLSGNLISNINTSAFPDPAVTPYIPLATIATGSASIASVSGKYDQVDIVDYRGRAIYELIG